MDKTQFLKKVRFVGDCWIWPGKQSKHRLSYKFFIGELPTEDKNIPRGERKIVGRTCGNFMCVRPEHLEVRTRDENTEYIIKNGFGIIGTLTEKQKAHIKGLAEKGYTEEILAEIFDVSQKVVHYILTGEIRNFQNHQPHDQSE